MMIVTISGTPGSGKSTVAKALAKELGAQRIYVGGIRRQLAKDKGMTLEELNEYAKTHPETDVDVDKAASLRARELSEDGKIVVAEGRVQFHFLPESLKIFIKTDWRVAAERIWKEINKGNSKRDEGNFNSVEELRKGLEQREDNDAKRYLKYYGFDHRDESKYAFVLDTTDLSIEEEIDKVVEYVKSKQ